MDLLQTVRKEGSRGGVNFSWDDVKTSNRRENYLGHSLMAPVGRWQQNKDLNWYAKAEDAELTPEERLEKEQERKREEKRKIKEAEEDAMAKALGLPVPDRSNANLEPLGMDKTKQIEMNKALKDTLGESEALERQMLPTRHGKSEQRRIRSTEGRRDSRDARSSKRRDRSKDRERDHRHRRDHKPRQRSRSRSRLRSRSRSRSHSRNREAGHRRRHRSRERYSRYEDQDVRHDDRYKDRGGHGREGSERHYRQSRSRSPYRKDRRRTTG